MKKSPLLLIPLLTLLFFICCTSNRQMYILPVVVPSTLETPRQITEYDPNSYPLYCEVSKDTQVVYQLINNHYEETKVTSTVFTSYILIGEQKIVIRRDRAFNQ